MIKASRYGVVQGTPAGIGHRRVEVFAEDSLMAWFARRIRYRDRGDSIRRRLLRHAADRALPEHKERERRFLRPTLIAPRLLALILLNMLIILAS